jgi:LacI family transcriptional regulator
VFCLSDSIAYGVYVACAELGLRIPDDVSVVGFDDHPISRLLQPALTTTDWGAESVARSATGFLIAALDDNVTDRRRLVEPTLRPRASTGPPSRVA